MKSKKVFFLILVALLVTGTMLGCNKKENKQLVTTENIETKQEASKRSSTSTKVAKATVKTTVTKVTSEVKMPKATSMPVTKSTSVPVTKPTSITVEKQVPGTKPTSAVNPTDYINAMRGTSSPLSAATTLLPVLVSGVNIGEAKIHIASAGFKQKEIDKLNLGLSEGRKLYAYWISTGHDYDIFGNPSKENLKNKWVDHMVEAAELLGRSTVNTAETKALAREFQFIAQEIVNYQTYGIKAKEFTASGAAANAKLIGATIATVSFTRLTGYIKNKL